jgi:hypothetical protein
MGVDIDVVQTEFGKIGFLMSDIMRCVYSASDCNLRAIEVHMQKLDTWHQELPEYMQLRTLLGSAVGLNTTRSILLVHLTYLGSIILLTRKVVVELLSPTVGGIVDGTSDEALHYLSVCLGAAKHIATIVGMLHSNGSIFRRCWLVMYSPLLPLAWLRINNPETNHSYPSPYCSPSSSRNIATQRKLSPSSRTCVKPQNSSKPCSSVPTATVWPAATCT